MSRDDFTSLWKRAKRCFEQGDNEAELKIYQKLEKMGFSLEVSEAKGLLCEKMGRFEEAIQAYKKGRKWAQKSRAEEWRVKFWRREIAALVSILLGRESYSKATKILRQAIKKDCQNPGFHELLAKVYFNLEDWDLGLEELDEVIKLDEDPELKAATFFNKGLVLRDRGNIEGAKQAYLEAIKTNSCYAPSYVNLGNIYWSQRDEEKGFQLWQQAEEMGCQEVSLFYNLAAGYIKRQDWERGRAYIRKILEKDPQAIEDLLIKFPFFVKIPEVYLLVIDEILEVKNQKIEEEFFRILREEKCDRENIERALVFRGLEKIEKMEKREKKGKNIRTKDQESLDLIENGLKIIDEERKAKEMLISEWRKWIKVLKALMEKRKQEEREEKEVYEKFFLKYQGFIDKEEFQLYLEEAQEKGKIIKEIEKVVDNFVRGFERRNLELTIKQISFEERPRGRSGLKIIESGRGNYVLSFVFNIASKRFLESVDLEELASHYVSQAEMWAKLPDYLAEVDGPITQVPERLEFRQWLIAQKIRNIKTNYHQRVIEAIDRESMNLVLDILKPYFQFWAMQKELVFLGKELDYWSEVLSQEEDILEELPILARRAVALDRIPEKEFRQLKARFEELMEPADSSHLKEIHRYYQYISEQTKLKMVREEVKKRKKRPEIRFEE